MMHTCIIVKSWSVKKDKLMCLDSPRHLILKSSISGIFKTDIYSFV